MDLYFGGTDPIVRLDTTDAKFVEVIHSNAATFTNMGLGIPGAIGHVDHYPVILISPYLQLPFTLLLRFTSLLIHEHSSCYV